MRDQHGVVELSEARCQLWFVFVHVETGTGNRTTAQCSDQRCLVDDRTTSGVDEVRRGTHRLELLWADEMMRLGGVRAVDRHDVGGAQQLIEAEALGAELGLDLARHGAAIAIGHRHAERLGPPGQRLADRTHADDAEAAALQARAQQHEHAPLPRLVRADDALALAQATGDHQDQRHGDVGRGIGQHTGCVGRDHASLAARGHVDVVVPDRNVGDHLQLRACGVEEGSVDLGRQQGQDGIGVGDAFVQLFDLDRLVVLPAPHVAVRSQHVETSIGDSSSDDDPRLGHQAASIHTRRLPTPARMSSTEIPE